MNDHPDTTVAIPAEMAAVLTELGLTSYALMAQSDVMSEFHDRAPWQARVDTKAYDGARLLNMLAKFMQARGL